VKVLFTNRTSGAGLTLMPETETEMNYLLNLDFDNLQVSRVKVDGSMWGLDVQPVPATPQPVSNAKGL
jgi:hypothetical protein